VFLEVRDAAAHILENTSIADIAGAPTRKAKKKNVRSMPEPASAQGE
jgi:hypothetical protein